MGVVTRRISDALRAQDGDAPTDARLLECFLATHDETAFATLAALTEGVVRAMLISKLKIASAVLLAACFAVAGVGFALSTAPADGQEQKKPAQPPAQPQPNDKKLDGKKPDDKKGDPKADPKKGDMGNNEKNGQNNQNGNDEQGVVKAVDPNANTITVVVQQQGKPVEKVFTLPNDVPVTLGGKPAKLGDVKPGMKVNIALNKDKKGVAGIKQVNEPNGQNNNGNDGQKNQKNG